MDFGFWDIIQVIGALCFFVFGMKMMSDGIQRAAGSQLRNILRSMTKNRFLGVGTGFLTTALVQSSSATTVMTVSFVNAGLLTLVESAGIMMGANVGTTITGWIVSVLGFKINLSAYSVPLFAIGVPMLFSNRSRLKYYGEFIIGFAILFLGLSYLKSAVPDLRGSTQALDFLANFTNWGIFSRLLFVLIGTIITIVVQSSSAAMAVTLTMCAQGWLPFEVAAAMILGENIGTTITAEVASLVGNTNARRSARIHSMFNILGVAWMVILLPVILPIISSLAQAVFGIADPYTDATDMPIGLSAFHTAFNLMNLLIMIGFVSTLVRIAKWSVPDKEGDEDEYRLKFIGAGIRTPELATVELQKETAHFGEITARMSSFVKDIVNTRDAKIHKKRLKKLSKYEKITDRLEIEITEYITELAKQQITPRTSQKLRSILNICNDLERIGDLYFQIAKTLEQKNDTRTYFLPEQRTGLNNLITLIDKAFVEMNKNLKFDHYDKVDIAVAQSIEKEINKLRSVLRKENQSRLGEKEYSTASAMIYSNLFSTLEQIGDHIYNVNQSIIGEI